MYGAVGESGLAALLAFGRGGKLKALGLLQRAEGKELAEEEKREPL